MTDALVSREQLWYGRFPRVCVKTGVAADRTVVVNFERVPPWTFLLLFAGILPFFVAAVFLRERVHGRVPVTEQVVERYHAFKRWLWLGWGVAGVGLLLRILTQSSWMLLVVVGGALIVLATEVRRTASWIGGVPVRGAPFVELRRVHPAFAAAVAGGSGSDSDR
jgi:hypothetical protein